MLHEVLTGRDDWQEIEGQLAALDSARDRYARETSRIRAENEAKRVEWQRAWDAAVWAGEPLPDEPHAVEVPVLTAEFTDRERQLMERRSRLLTEIRGEVEDAARARERELLDQARRTAPKAWQPIVDELSALHQTVRMVLVGDPRVTVMQAEIGAVDVAAVLFDGGSVFDLREAGPQIIVHGSDAPPQAAPQDPPMRFQRSAARSDGIDVSPRPPDPAEVERLRRAKADAHERFLASRR